MDERDFFVDIKKITLPAICLFLSACTSGHNTSFVPDLWRHSCNGLNFSAHPNTVEESYWEHFLIYQNKVENNNTHDGVTVDFFVRREREIKLTEDDIYIKDLGNGLKHKPIRLLISRQFFRKGKYYTNFKANFAITNDTVEEFELFFNKTLDGCSIPTIHYKKKYSKHFMESINR